MKYNPTLHKLSNGVTVILDPMDLETTNIKIHFNTGSRDEASHEYGLTHFCEHMFGKGSTRFPSKKFIDDYMDYWGGTRNAATGNKSLDFYGRILAKNLDKLIDFFGDTLQNALFDTDKIDIERRVICDELRRAQDRPDRQFTDFISKNLFDYATFSTRNLGSVESIMSFTREQMKEFLSRRLSAKNCIIGISGKIVDTDATLSLLEKSFSFLPTHNVSENTDIKYTPSVIHNLQSDKKNVRLAILFPDIFSPRYEDRYNNFAIGRFERFYIKALSDILRQENGLVYGFSGYGVGNEKFALTGFYTETAPENIEQVVSLIAKNTYDIYTNPKITPDDLDRYNRKDCLGDADWMESAGRRCDKLIGFYRNYGRLYDFYETVKMFEQITVSDVIEKTRCYFDGPISIITQGADFKSDIKMVWDKSYK
ncbi:MAG: insulinase family protein [Alphaproteobacteria bacterium]|nr:insulinase family protein [Alphaproteobacteria bacterium]